MAVVSFRHNGNIIRSQHLMEAACRSNPSKWQFEVEMTVQNPFVTSQVNVRRSCVLDSYI